jgi:putative transposase
MRYTITDEVWDVLGPMVERCKSPFGPEPDLPERMFFEAVLYWARTGCPWRDLPGEFGNWSAVYNRLRRWVASGRLKKLFESMAAQPECEGVRRVMVDSTVVRAHQHAAGALKKKGAPRRRRSAGPAAATRPRSSPPLAMRTAW